MYYGIDAKIVYAAPQNKTHCYQNTRIAVDLNYQKMEFAYRNIELITQCGSTVYIGIAMVFVFPPYIREIQFLLLVSSQFDF